MSGFEEENPFAVSLKKLSLQNQGSKILFQKPEFLSYFLR